MLSNYCLWVVGFEELMIEVKILANRFFRKNLLVFRSNVFDDAFYLSVRWQKSLLIRMFSFNIS